MVAPGGPDDETWSKMSNKSRKIYVGIVIAFWFVFLCLLIKKFIIH